MNRCLTPNQHVEEICDKIIKEADSRPRKRRDSFVTKKLMLCAETSELMKGLFCSLDPNDLNKVKCTDLIDHLIRLGIRFDPSIFGQVLKKLLKVDSIKNAKISFEEFSFLLFDDKRIDKVIDILKLNSIPRRAHSVLPNILSKSPKREKEDKFDDLRNVVKHWWDEISPMGYAKAPFGVVSEFLIEKGVVSSNFDAKKLFNNLPCITMDFFFEAFCIPLIKLQIIQAAKKVNDIRRPFISPYQKLSSIKRKLLISRISPDCNRNHKVFIENVMNEIVTFKKHLRSNLK